ncbi:hypothetical protein AN477_20220 [Alicyclobacillus ferrooxydans]|uniref:Uncharacterized protein n=1 Tax=Alicyclobacillus ferrooxydans TaxID=471514 RepID=A0A0P9CYF2_9BACL|nr:hypothetical protein AN477_20220 [Alicyclobacillus ferrooxydans]
MYTLSKTAVPFGEIALFIVACGALGGIAWLCVAGATCILSLVRLPLNTAPIQNRVVGERGDWAEQAKQTWHNSFRLLQGGKDG